MAYLDPNILRIPQQPTPVEQMGQAYQLGEFVEKRREREQQQKDSAWLQEQLKGGANLNTPEGIAKMMEASKGNVSPELTMKLGQYQQEFEKNALEKMKAYAALPEARQKAIYQQNQFIVDSLTGPAQAYQTALDQGKSPEEAMLAFNSAKTSVLDNADRMGTNLPGGFQLTEQMRQTFRNMTPQQLLAAKESGEYQMSVLDQATLAERRAKADADKALAEQRRSGKPATELMGLIEQFGEDSPEVQAYLSKMKGKGSAAKGSAGGGEAMPGGVGSDTFQDTSTGQRYVINKRSGKAWEANDDGTFKQIPLKSVPDKVVPMGKIGTMGSIESRFTQRVLLSANEALRDLENVSQLPITVSSGIFGGRTQGPGLLDATKEVLANTMTQEDTQLYNTMSTGFQRSLAAIEAAGLMPTGSLTHQMDAVVFKEGDTNLTKMSKLAQVRQIVDAGLEVMESNPRLSDSEKEQAKKIRTGLESAVPFTQRDVTKWMKASQKNPNVTMADVMGKKKAAVAEKTERPMEFRTVAEAQAAASAGKLKPNTKVVIGGRSGTWQ